MRRLVVVLACLGCRSSESSSSKVTETGSAATPSGKPAAKPPDEMDEKMRHCPVALDGAVSSLEDIAGGVRFTIKVPATALAEVQRRARHVVDFAAKRTREGHGGFDGKGGGHMKNCPVVTDQVSITATDIDGGAQLDIVTDAANVDGLRRETRDRVKTFPYTGATITLSGVR